MRTMTTVTRTPVKTQEIQEKMRSGYIHERRDNRLEMQRRFNSYDNRMFMRSFDIERISDILDSVSHFHSHK